MNKSDHLMLEIMFFTLVHELSKVIISDFDGCSDKDEKLGDQRSEKKFESKAVILIEPLYTFCRNGKNFKFLIKYKNKELK